MQRQPVAARAQRSVDVLLVEGATVPTVAASWDHSDHTPGGSVEERGTGLFVYREKCVF